MPPVFIELPLGWRLEARSIAQPSATGELRVQVSVCRLCRTDPKVPKAYTLNLTRATL